MVRLASLEDNAGSGGSPVDGLITRRQQIRLLLQIIRELIDERDALESKVERLQSDQASRRWQEEQ